MTQVSSRQGLVPDREHFRAKQTGSPTEFAVDLTVDLSFHLAEGERPSGSYVVGCSIIGHNTCHSHDRGSRYKSHQLDSASFAIRGLFLLHSHVVASFMVTVAVFAGGRACRASPGPGGFAHAGRHHRDRDDGQAL